MGQLPASNIPPYLVGVRHCCRAADLACFHGAAGKFIAQDRRGSVLAGGFPPKSMLFSWLHLPICNTKAFVCAQSFVCNHVRHAHRHERHRKIWGVSENCQHPRTAGLFALCCVIFPCNTPGIIGRSNHGFAAGSRFKKKCHPRGWHFFLEQGTGVEPASAAWEAAVLPMYEPCILTSQVSYHLLTENATVFCRDSNPGFPDGNPG